MGAHDDNAEPDVPPQPDPVRGCGRGQGCGQDQGGGRADSNTNSMDVYDDNAEPEVPLNLI